MTTTTRIAPGHYEVELHGRTVLIDRFEHLDARYGQWVARAEWDKHTYTDPLFTLAEAKRQAQYMLDEVAQG